VTAPANDEVSGGWIAPFVMADVNTRVVHRTHALLGRPWGEDFIYEEALATGRGPLGGLKAAGVAGGMLGGMGLLAVGPVRKVLSDHVLPSPGDGPNASAQASGFYDLRFYGSTDGGRSIRTKVTGDRDPGYGSTAKILGEAAVCLLDTAQSKVAGGFWTPATAMGSTLIERLEAHAGLSFSVVD